MIKKLFSALIIPAALILSCENKTDFEVSEGTESIPAVGIRGMVSSAHSLATETGLNILKQGGNAFDAAVAVAAVLNVVEPGMSGMGGYGTILIYDAEKKEVRFLDSSGKIPAAVNSDVFRLPTPGYKENRRGPKAVSTPGNVNAWSALSKEYGKLPWEELFKPAIKFASEGFSIGPGLNRMIDVAYSSFQENSREIYGIKGHPLREGELLIQNDLADSFRKISSLGSKALYGGEIGQAFDREMRLRGGFLSLDDLLADRAEWWKPVHIKYRNCEVYTASPPSTAFPSLIRLGMMSMFDNAELGSNSTGFLHRFAEVTKHAFWCRLTYAGDPEINPPPLSKLLSKEYWKQQVKKIDMQKASPFIPPEVTINQGINTTHFVTADQWGNIVSATQTLGNLFGSRIMPEGTGIWLNNSLAYCTFEPKGNPMDAHAGHRKLSGDCPTIIIKNDKPWVAIGTPGGHTIGQTVPQMVMNLIDFGMDIQMAIAAPRVSFIEPDWLAIEESIPFSVREELISLGHNVRVAGSLGNAHGLAIEYDEKGRILRFTGGADPRGGGKAAGY